MTVVDIEEARKKKGKKKKERAAAGDWPTHTEWWQKLRLNEAGVPKPTLGNATLFLEHEDSLAGVFRWNEMSGHIEMAGTSLTDADVTGVRVSLESTYEVSFAEADVLRGLEVVAKKRPYHPVRAYLSGLEWDQTPRIPWLLSDVLHGEVSPLHETYLRKFLVSAVARAFKPGCKVDTVLILQGGQGAGKSTFFKVLGGEWFTDTEMDLGSKDAYLTLGSSWVVEWGELSALSRSTQERTKAFLSASEDIFRAPYARTTTRLPRTAVIVGSTNQTAILKDDTGSRRFWVLPITGAVDVAALREARHQVWAEAVELYRSRTVWWLDADEDKARADIAERYEEDDDWAPTVVAWAETQPPDVPFTLARLLGAIDVPTAQQSRGVSMRVAAILRGAGYKNTRVQIKGARATVWSKNYQESLGIFSG